MNRLMRFVSRILNTAAIAALAAIAGCASAPRPEVDAGKLRAIHTVTVIYPGKAVYSAARAQMPLMLVGGGGLLGAALTGAATGLVNASVPRQDPHAFDDLVTTKLGDTQVNRRFTDGIEAALRSHGYVVQEVDHLAPALPTFSRDQHFDWHADGPAYRDSDAVLLIQVTPWYSSSGPMSAYTRLINGEIVMFAGDTHEAIFRQRIHWKKAIDPYTYHFIENIEADLPHAISGLDESMMGQVNLFNESLGGVAR
jgi:hypothetical protein